MKRILEILASACGLIASSPLILILIPVIRLNSPGPAIFRQERVGKRQRNFTCYKLRTMAEGTKQLGTHEVGAASVTSVGRFLRKTKLDELPQLWNVLCGEMSLVGPRPCLPGQAELIEEREKRGVFEVLPGITGLGQVRGIDMSVPDRLAKCDEEYVQRQSLKLDLQLLLQTILGAGREDRVQES
ncbi:MAG: sugar transferase [Verrucomicrobiales bacterium]|nr:sugar transferase [Verrucomicrobiales bacterium]